MIRGHRMMFNRVAVIFVAKKLYAIYIIIKIASIIRIAFARG